MKTYIHIYVSKLIQKLLLTHRHTYGETFLRQVKTNARVDEKDLIVDKPLDDPTYRMT